MKEVGAVLTREMAETYATWFRALSDPTRVQILNLLAEHGGQLSVGEIVEQVDVGQPTVSMHLKVLAQARFVLRERRGTARLYQVNQACLTCFPTAADVVMGRTAVPFGDVDCSAPPRLAATQGSDR